MFCLSQFLIYARMYTYSTELNIRWRVLFPSTYAFYFKVAIDSLDALPVLARASDTNVIVY